MDTKNDKPVKPIKNGTVIDHITSDLFFDVHRILRSDSQLRQLLKNQPLFDAAHVNSQKYGRKDIIFFENVYPEIKELIGDLKLIAEDIIISPDKLNMIKLVAYNATINIVRDSAIVKKYNPELPKELRNILMCRNSPMYYEDESGHTRARGGCISYKHPAETGLRIEPIPYTHKLIKDGPEFEYACYFCERKIRHNEVLEYLILNPSTH